MKNVRRAMGVVTPLILAFLTLTPVLVRGETIDEGQQAAWNRLVATGRQSSDLRVRIVFSLGETEKRGDGYYLSEAIPVETLVEQARGSTDPIVLSLMVDRCFADLQKANRCDAVDFARRWTVVDTQNELAWIALSTALSNQGRIDGARAAFLRAAQASQWHEYASEVARLLAASIPGKTDAGMRPALLLAVLSKSFVSLPSGHYQTINRRCKEAALRDACGRILEVMARDAQSLITLNVAASLATARNVLPEAARMNMRQRSDAMRWAAIRHSESCVDETSSPADAICMARYVEMVIASSEIDTLRHALQDSGLGIGEAALKYGATLSAGERARRVAAGSTVPAPHQ